MLEKFFTSISAWMLTQQVATRHLIPAANETLHHPAEDAIFNALANNRNDVLVYWGAHESGKTAAVRNACLRLQGMDRLCVLLHGYDLTFPKGFARTLRMRIGVPDDGASLSTHLSRPALVVVDDFDFLAKEADEPLRALRELNTSTLLVVSSWERALELRDTHGCKLVEPAGVGRWTEAQLEALFQTLPQSVRDKWAGQEEKAELMRLSVVSGSAGYLVYEASSHDPFRGFQSDTGRRMARRAELLAAEWRNGVRAMGGGEEEGGDGGDGCAVGRFPDRDGVFHWD